jgi:hypothetical protein
MSFNEKFFVEDAVASPCTYAVDTNSNLVLNLDAGNSSSYSGTGTTWNDLSNNSNNATVVASNFNPTTATELGNFGVLSAANGYPYGSSVTPARPYIAHNTNLDISPNFSLAIWFRKNGAGGGGLISKRNSGPDYGWGIEDTRTNLQFFMYGSYAASYALIQKDITAYNNVWTQVVITWATTTLKMYINGAPVATATTPSPSSSFPDNNTGPLIIGQKYNTAASPTPAFNGWVQQVKIWQSLLSPSDVTAEFNKKKACFGL